MRHADRHPTTPRPVGHLRRLAIAGVLPVAVLAAAACSSSGSGGAGATGSSPGSTAGSVATGSGATGSRPGSTVARPAGPAADLSEEITGTGKPFMGAATGTEIPAGYVEHEYVAAGTATDYTGANPPPADGRWALTPGTTAPYRTRVIVRRPADPARFSGTVIVEWLNVSGGLDANPDYASLSEEITRRGDAWVGVSAQLIGIEGGPVLVKAPGTENIVGKGLKALDPARYASLAHPGDGYAFDIYTQVARAARAGGPALGGTAPDVVLAAGESQSAIALTTYYDGVQPLTQAFDGFFIHSRAFAPLPLVAPGKYADLAGSMAAAPPPVLLRTDLDVPVLELQTEGDVIGVLNSVAVRQPDSGTFRLWEVAGGSHADVHLLGSIAGSLDCGVPINDGATHVVAKAGLRALTTWVRTGQAPPTAPRLEVTDGDKPAVARDADGIARGGVRTPPVDVPVDVLSGSPGPNNDLLCLLMGSTTALPADRIAARYASRSAYEQAFAQSADATIAAGFALREDRDALIAFAHPDRITP